MAITLNSRRLTAGVVVRGDELIIPAGGGGIWLDELKDTGERYLCFRLEALEDHSMPFAVKVYGAAEEPSVSITIGVMPRFPANICIDLNWLDGHILFPGHRPGELKVVCHGSRIARSDIRKAEIVSLPAFHDLRVKIDDLSLRDAPSEPTPIPDIKLIDEMGQYIPKQWPGKQKDPESLSALLRAQVKDLSEFPYKGWTKYGGCAARKLKPGTGFFSRAKENGRWYLTDPEGCAFFSTGPDCINLSFDARVDGLEKLLKWLPQPGEDAYQDMRLGFREFGEVERGASKMVSFGRVNMRRAFGDAWKENWIKQVISQLKANGLNTIGNWSDPELYGKMPYVGSLPRFPQTEHLIFRDFPDVFAPEYELDARKCAQALAPFKDDPMLIGYFLRNEPNWAFVDKLVLAREALMDPVDTYTKRALIEWLKLRYTSVKRLNLKWGADMREFDDLLSPANSRFEGADADLREFSAIMVKAYTGIPAAACREVDPNHMILGMRWAWISDPALIAGWEAFDVFSINNYSVDPTRALNRVYDLGVDLPILIGEYHAGALDAGQTATGLEGVTSQRQRGVAYRYYTERVAAHPYGVGCHYFQYMDQFALGRFDGENYNIGLFDICLQPYKEMMDAILECGKHIYEVKDGAREPFAELPESIPMIAF